MHNAFEMYTAWNSSSSDIRAEPDIARFRKLLKAPVSNLN